MSWDYTVTEEELYERDGDEDGHLEPLECGESCGHYDELNQCCWLSWRNRQEGDVCSYGLYRDASGMIVKVLWKKKEAEA